MDVFKSLQIKNVQTSQEIEEIQNVILMIIKDENPDYLYNPDDKLLVFPQLPETVALNVDFLMHRLQD